MPWKPCRVAIVQQPPVYLNLQASLERAGQLLLEAAEAGAELVVFPETWLPGYPIWLDEAPGAALWDAPGPKAVYRLLWENALEIPGPAFEQLQALVRESERYVVLGMHERLQGTLYNTQLFLQPDGSWALHRKLVPTYTERLIWGRGDGSTLTVVETPFGRLGGLICWEHWMPLARAAMHARFEQIHVAQWPSVHELHQIASRHYAFEGRCFVLAAGTVLRKQDVLDGLESLSRVPSEARELLASIPGDPERLLQTGGSAVIGPDGHYVAEPVWNEPAFVTATIDPERIPEGLLTLDVDGHYARPDVFHLEVNTRPQLAVTFRSETP